MKGQLHDFTPAEVLHSQLIIQAVCVCVHGGVAPSFINTSHTTELPRLGRAKEDRAPARSTTSVHRNWGPPIAKQGLLSLRVSAAGPVTRRWRRWVAGGAPRWQRRFSCRVGVPCVVWPAGSQAAGRPAGPGSRGGTPLRRSGWRPASTDGAPPPCPLATRYCRWSRHDSPTPTRRMRWTGNTQHSTHHIVL